MLKRILKRLAGFLYRCYHFCCIWQHEMHSIRAKRHLWEKIRLTRQQQRKIEAFFGRKMNLRWHRLYQSYTGTFNKAYFPEVLFSTRLEPILCPQNVCSVLQDKGLVDILYGSIPGLRLPKTIAVNCSGIYYDGERRIIDRENAIMLTEQWSLHNRFVIKPTVNTHSGNGVFVSVEGESYGQEKLQALFQGYRQNFIIQEYIENCQELKGLYSKSLNTIRIMTYILDGGMYHASPIMRLGKGGNVVDNVDMGGLFIGMNEDGYLNKEAYMEFGGRFTHHPDSGVRFEGYYIPNIRQLIEYAYLCHRRTPHTRFISWDFTLDENRTPVLIEANMLGHTSWFPQAASGVSLFGDNTKKMLDLIGAD